MAVGSVGSSGCRRRTETPANNVPLDLYGNLVVAVVVVDNRNSIIISIVVIKKNDDAKSARLDGRRPGD